jgi:hypothetical protein
MIGRNMHMGLDTWDGGADKELKVSDRLVRTQRVAMTTRPRGVIREL